MHVEGMSVTSHVVKEEGQLICESGILDIFPAGWLICGSPYMRKYTVINQSPTQLISWFVSQYQVDCMVKCENTNLRWVSNKLATICLVHTIQNIIDVLCWVILQWCMTAEKLCKLAKTTREVDSYAPINCKHTHILFTIDFVARQLVKSTFPLQKSQHICGLPLNCWETVTR